MSQGTTKLKKVLSIENLADEYTKVFSIEKLKPDMASAALPRFGGRGWCREGEILRER